MRLPFSVLSQGNIVATFVSFKDILMSKKVTKISDHSFIADAGTVAYCSLCLLCADVVLLMRVWGISRTSGDQNLHFDAKIDIACASLGQKSHKR